MAELGHGYGSEFHLLRYLARHRARLSIAIQSLLGASEVGWLDVPAERGRRWGDGEWKGLDFLPPDDPAADAWRQAWPTRGNPPNWDAVGTVRGGGGKRAWLLVEAKANERELQSDCTAQEHGGRPLIAATLGRTKRALGVDPERDWLRGYYQYCNRIAVLHFLREHGVPAQLLFIYFCGDEGGSGRVCAKDEAEWQPALQRQRDHVGLPADHPLKGQIHALFLPVSALQ
jgi:hypothetical protein